MAYTVVMIILESHYFTQIIQELMPDDMYAELQKELVRCPSVGNLIPGSGGLRKIRWKLSGKGKRGGARVIYYWVTDKDQIYMVYAYAKAKSENLTKEQLSLLKQVVAEELKNG